MTTVRAIDRLPEFRDAKIEQRARDYIINGVKYARVTSALGVINKPALVPWARNQAFEALRAVWLDPTFIPDVGQLDHHDAKSLAAFCDVWIDEAKRRPESQKVAAELGTQAHALIHRLLEGDTAAAEEIPEGLRPAVLGASRFLRDNRIQPVRTEFTVWDQQQKLAGTIDGVGWRDGNLVIWDWKRSKGLYPEMALQLASYANLFELTTSTRVNEAWVVRLPQAAVPDGEPMYEAKQVSDLAASLRVYRLAYNLQQGLKADPWRRTP